MSSNPLPSLLSTLPTSPTNPQTLETLLVVAFGAFSRYYICWRNLGGGYHQEANDLPPALHTWLFPEGGKMRDFETLQVVFGCSGEFFARDGDGGCESKGWVNKNGFSEQDRNDGMAKRDGRVSYIRPVSDPVPKVITVSSGVGEKEMGIEKGREKGRRFTLSVPGKFMEGKERRSRQRPQSMSFHPDTGTFTRILEDEKPYPPTEKNSIITEEISRECCTCTCNYHTPPPLPKPQYKSSSTQTSPPPSPTLSLSSSSSSSTHSSYTGVSTPNTSHSSISNPVFMGRMLDYFHGPRYQLGDALVSGYWFRMQQAQLVYDEGMEWKGVGIERRWTV